MFTLKMFVTIFMLSIVCLSNISAQENIEITRTLSWEEPTLYEDGTVIPDSFKTLIKYAIYADTKTIPDDADKTKLIVLGKDISENNLKITYQSLVRKGSLFIRATAYIDTNEEAKKYTESKFSNEVKVDFDLRRIYNIEITIK